MTDSIADYYMNEQMYWMLLFFRKMFYIEINFIFTLETSLGCGVRSYCDSPLNGQISQIYGTDKCCIIINVTIV